MTYPVTPDSVPYPLPGMPANGSSHLETMARFTDSRLDRLDTEWPTQMLRPTRILSRSSNLTGLVWLGDNIITFNQVTYSTTGAFTGSPTGDIIPIATYAGWYAINLRISTQPSGGSTLGTIREIKLRTFVYHALHGGPLVDEFIVRDYESGGPASFLELNAVTYLSPAHRVFAYVWHNDPAGDLTATTTGTFLTATLIAPKAVM